MSFHITAFEVTAGVGLSAFTAAMLGLAQKIRNDRRAAWWSRAQWAIDKSLSDDEQTRHVGTDAMQVLAQDRTATEADLQVLDSALIRALDRS